MKDDANLPQSVKNGIRLYGREQAVCDYIAGMTDQFALKEYERLFIPHSWKL